MHTNGTPVGDLIGSSVDTFLATGFRVLGSKSTGDKVDVVKQFILFSTTDKFNN